MQHDKICPRCGARLDPGESCGCQISNRIRFNRLLNGCRKPSDVYNALLALGNAGLLGRKNAPAGAADADEGKAEKGQTDSDSASIIPKIEEESK